MRFSLLGPVMVERDGSLHTITSAMPRTVLAALLLNSNAVVSFDQLVEAVWGERPPNRATASLHNHLMRLRRLLGDESGTRIRTVARGYLIRVDPGELDLHAFADLSASGTAAVRDRQWAKASDELAAALALWRGEPVADVPTMRHDPRIQRLLESKLQALAGRIEADIELGRHREVISELRALTAENPLREDFHGQLMLALHRAQRHAEALGTYQGLRRTLVDELGVEPSLTVRQLHQQILNADREPATPVQPAKSPPPLLDAPASTSADEVADAASLGGSPCQLPADTRVFTGRTREMDLLVDLARQASDGSGYETVVISAIDGMAGIGKTALAVHAAHGVADRFPDGQLFVDLRGHTTGLASLTAGDALDWLLRTLGVPPQLIPQDLGERAAFYRARLAGTRTLVLLDNASGTAQVRPLLPGCPGCLVLVTSRKRLAGLDDAHTLALDILSKPEADRLLHKVAGPGRIPANHPAIPELLALCGYMPLAVRITAARLRHRRALTIEGIVDQLRDEHSRLELLEDEDRNLTAVFESSYTNLPEPEQHLFRLLGLVPGPDFDPYAAANLIGTDHRTAERLLESLLDHNLLTQRTPGRYRFHDLVRLYARALGENVAAEQPEGALDRLLDYYLHTAQAADRHLTRQSRPGPVPTTTSPVDAPDLPDRATAQAWMRTERDNLFACAAHAQPPHVIAITSALAAFLLQEGPWSQAAALQQTAATAAQEGGSRLDEAGALSELGRLRQLTGVYTEAAELMERSLAIYRELGSRQGEANALHDLGRVRYMTGAYTDADVLLERARTIYQDLGDRQGEANALCELGRLQMWTSNFPAAISLLEHARRAFQELGDRQGEAHTLRELGLVRTTTGDCPTARDLLERAIAIYQELENRQGEGHALLHLGPVLLVTGDYAAAGVLLERSLAILQGLGSRLGTGEGYALKTLGCVRLATGDHAAAVSLLERGLAVFQDLGDRHGEANILQSLGCVRLATGDYAAAGSLLQRALANFHDLGDRQGEAETLNSTGALAAATAGPHAALTLYRQAVDIAREIHSPLDEARALEGAGRAAAGTGDPKAALIDLREAVALYQRIGAAEAASAEAYLAALEGMD